MLPDEVDGEAMHPKAAFALGLTGSETGVQLLMIYF
jgi:hypothetical protein